MKNLEIGSKWSDVRKEVFTPEEIAASDLRVARIGELIKVRLKSGMSQRKLEEMEDTSTH